MKRTMSSAVSASQHCVADRRRRQAKPSMIGVHRRGTTHRRRAFLTYPLPLDSPTGELLRRYRFRAGLSQGELAVRAGVSIRAVRYIEQGRVARPHASSMYRLAEALDLPATDRDALLAATEARPAQPPTADEL